jgi:hypothetical protein
MNVISVLLWRSPLLGTKHEDAYQKCGEKDVALKTSRWWYVSHIHAVMSNIWQLYLFQSLEWKHYHCDQITLEEAVAKEVLESDLSLKLRVYLPTEDVLDSPFLKLINIKFDVFTEASLSSIPWLQMTSELYQDTVLEQKNTPVDISKKESPPICPTISYRHRIYDGSMLDW